MNYVIGITTNGERLRFERWVYESWRCGILGDEMLKQTLRRCVRFIIMY